MKDKINPAPLSWKEEYAVNIAVIDEQHKKFLDIINDLHKVMQDKNGAEKLPKIFFQIAYLIDHYFIKEEIYFKDLKYPNFEQHKIAHNLFIDRIIQFQKEMETNKSGLCEDIYNYLLQWFNEHILKYDKEAVEYLKRSGLN